MSAAVMTARRATEASPRIQARTATVFYLLEDAPIGQRHTAEPA
jgi:hypothetical protein